LATKKEFDEWLSASSGKETTLSAAAVETLAVIAAEEPVTRAEIERVRGVGAGRILASLMEKDLIEERGRLDSLGRPILYGTTRRFLASAGLSDVKELQKKWNERMTEGDLF
jgi:segregation and condensation protein B